jgi:hypothetical protein
MKTPKQQLSDQEIVKRRDEAVRRALNTPPKPLKEMKAAKAKAKGKPIRPEKHA